MNSMTGRGAMLLFTATLALLSGSGQATAGQAGVLDLTHVSVIDATGAPEKADQTVLIQDGQIKAVGPAGRVAPPKGARIVDARGKFLIPGLWDMHSHIHFEGPEVLPVYVAYGVMGIRDLDTAMPLVDRIRARDRQGELLAPRIVATGNMVEAVEVRDAIGKMGLPAVTDFVLQDRIFVKDAAEARAAVRTIAAGHPDWIKLHQNFKRDIFFAVIDEARKYHLRVAAHYPSGEKVTLREAAEAGLGSVEHLYWPGVAADFKAMTPAGQDELIAQVKASGLAFDPTLVTGNMAGQTKYLAKDGSSNSAQAQLGRASQDRRARLISPYMRRMWADMLSIEAQQEAGGAEPGRDFATEIAMLRRFNKAGVPIVAGTDLTVQFLFPGSSLHEEMEELVKQVGMTPYEALQAATRRSAELAGVQGQLGTVEAGKAADLVLLDADPLADISNTQKIRAVIRHGRLLDRKELDAILDKAAARLRQVSGPSDIRY